MMLSTVNITPDHTTVLSDLAVGEVAVAGYARQSLGAWGAATIAAGIATAVGAGLTFGNTGVTDSPVIYTWGIVSGDTTRLIMAGRWATPFVLSALTGSFPTNPTAHLDGLPP